MTDRQTKKADSYKQSKQVDLKIAKQTATQLQAKTQKTAHTHTHKAKNQPLLSIPAFLP